MRTKQRGLGEKEKSSFLSIVHNMLSYLIALFGRLQFVSTAVYPLSRGTVDCSNLLAEYHLGPCYKAKYPLGRTALDDLVFHHYKKLKNCHKNVFVA